MRRQVKKDTVVCKSYSFDGHPCHTPPVLLPGPSGVHLCDGSHGHDYRRCVVCALPALCSNSVHCGALSIFFVGYVMHTIHTLISMYSNINLLLSKKLLTLLSSNVK